MADPKEPGAEDDLLPEDELSVEDELEDETPADDESPADDEPPADDQPPSDDEPPPEDEPAPKPPSRAARRIQALDTRLKTLERENAELKRRPAAPDPTAIAEQHRREAAEEEAALLTGDAGRIAKFYSDRATRQVDQRLNQIAFHSADIADKTAFSGELVKHPELAAVADEVEDRLAQARAGGINPQRFALAKILFAERILSRSKPAKTRQTRQAATANARQAARPGSGRSDVPAGSRRTGDTQAKRGQRLDESGLL